MTPAVVYPCHHVVHLFEECPVFRRWLVALPDYRYWRVRNMMARLALW